MSNEEKATTSGVRKVIVDIATHDDDGNPITDDMLSSGGARDRGPLVKQYTNPRPYQGSSFRSNRDRDVEANLRREADLQRRREDELRREEQEAAVALAKFCFDVAERLFREILAPGVRRMWKERELNKRAVLESRTLGGDVNRSSVNNEREASVATVVESGAETGEAAAVEVNALAPVVQIDDYRRSA